MLNMPQESSAALRDALDQMERSRKRGLLITRIALYPAVVFLVMSVLLMLFHSNKWLGLTYGIISLFGMIGAAALDIERCVNASTQRILKAIDMSFRGEPRA
jgi:hypothetical protein